MTLRSASESTRSTHSGRVASRRGINCGTKWPRPPQPRSGDEFNDLVQRFEVSAKQVTLLKTACMLHRSACCPLEVPVMSRKEAVMSCGITASPNECLSKSEESERLILTMRRCAMYACCTSSSHVSSRLPTPMRSCIQQSAFETPSSSSPSSLLSSTAAASLSSFRLHVPITDSILHQSLRKFSPGHFLRYFTIGTSSTST